MDLAAVCSNAVLLSLLIHCLLLVPYFMGVVFGPCFEMHYYFFFLFCNHITEEERIGCFTLIVFLLSCGC